MESKSLTLATATKALSVQTPEELNLLPPLPGLSTGLNRGQRAGRSSRRLGNVSLTGCKDKQITWMRCGLVVVMGDRFTPGTFGLWGIIILGLLWSLTKMINYKWLWVTGHEWGNLKAALRFPCALNANCDATFFYPGITDEWLYENEFKCTNNFFWCVCNKIKVPLCEDPQHCVWLKTRIRLLMNHHNCFWFNFCLLAETFSSWTEWSFQI